MRSKFWEFVEACDDATSARVVKDMLAVQLQAIGFESYALVSHLPQEDLRHLSVLAHNWSREAIDHLFIERLDGKPNPIFEAAEQSFDVIYWSSPTWESSLIKSQRNWLNRLRKLVGKNGASRAVKSAIVPASCSLTSLSELDSEQVRAGMRIAGIAYHYLQLLQRPTLSEQERLTAREHECLYRAAAYGERPSIVARRLGVKVSTVRTLRQKAYGRLDVDSPEQAVWRMLETGQLFRSGRRKKPRSR